MSNKPLGKTIVVTGANGWMGREFIHAWKLRDVNSRIIHAPRLDSESARILGAELAGSDDWTLVHLAFVTRERIASMGVDSYIDSNRQITQVALELIGNLRPSAVVHASSGAVFKSTDSYAQLKLEQEELVGKLCSDLKIPCINARIWSVSGAFCPKPRNFLFFDLLYQALFKDEVHVRAEHEVLRRYVDAGQFLGLATHLAHLRMSMNLDSGGELVSAIDLANRILASVGTKKFLIHADHLRQTDAYFSTSNSMEIMAESVGFDLGDLDWQIRNSIRTFENPKAP